MTDRNKIRDELAGEYINESIPHTLRDEPAWYYSVIDFSNGFDAGVNQRQEENAALKKMLPEVKDFSGNDGSDAWLECEMQKQKLQSENSRLAAGQCVVENGMLADRDGVRCVLKSDNAKLLAVIDEMKEALIEYRNSPAKYPEDGHDNACKFIESVSSQLSKMGHGTCNDKRHETN